jgi:hypothetical protein
MTPQNVVREAHALAADVHARTGDELDSVLATLLPAEGAPRAMANDLGVLVLLAAEDHGQQDS